jgi:hypothetical protein
MSTLAERCEELIATWYEFEKSTFGDSAHAGHAKGQCADELAAALAESHPQTTERRTVWLVELFHEGKSEGWWVGTPKDSGGWRTENAWAAKQYTESEARAVAAALDYFPAPSRWSHWVAMEHIFDGVDTHVAAVESQPQRGELGHTRSCPALTPGGDCTCGLEWRIQSQTEQELHAAWEKLAYDAPAKVDGLAEEQVMTNPEWGKSMSMDKRLTVQGAPKPNSDPIAILSASKVIDILDYAGVEVDRDKFDVVISALNAVLEQLILEWMEKVKEIAAREVEKGSAASHLGWGK